MLIATAGHVDHGKTALIKALTGQVTDRTPEEKRRGMSIELGYAYLVSPSGRRADLIDVPGHAKFMRTLIAGISRVETVLLVIAADDGPMPQTLEHIALVQLLGIRQVALVVSKCDRVDEDRYRAVASQGLALLAEAGLNDIPAFTVSSLTGAGMESLQSWLHQVVDDRTPPSSDSEPRFSIDRHFQQPGAGLILTGTVLNGQIRVGDSLCLSERGQPIRVRHIQIHGEPANQAIAGQRCALNVAGEIEPDAVMRGSLLLPKRCWQPTQRVDSAVSLIASVRGKVQLHIGNATVGARLVPLKGLLPDNDDLYGQWVLDQPICCQQGERFVIRDPAARALLGAGRVVDPFAPQRGRQQAARLAVLAAMDSGSAADTLQALLDLLPDGVDLARWALVHNLAQHQQETILGQLGNRAHRYNNWMIWQTRLDRMCGQLCETLETHHQQHPEQPGPTLPQMARSLGCNLYSKLLSRALRQLLTDGTLRQSGPCLHLPAHKPTPDPHSLAILEQVSDIFHACAPRPPVIGEIMQRLQIERDALIAELDNLSRLNLLVFVSRNRYLLPESVDALYRVLCDTASGDGTINTAIFRDRSGIGRNHSVAVLEYFDRAGFTRLRLGQRWLCAPAAP